MHLFKLSTGLCVLTFALGCGSQKSENEQGDNNPSTNSQGNVSALSSPFEALPSHPRFELSNLQFPSPNSFTANWRVTSGKAGGSWSLAVIPGGNSIPTSLPLNVWDDKTSGEVSGELRSYGGGDSGPTLDSGCEMFLTVNEGGHTFKISNSLTAGSASTTSAHPASDEVIAQVKQHRQQKKQPPQQETVQKSSQETPPAEVPKRTPSRAPFRNTPRPRGLVAVPPTLPIPNGTMLMAQQSMGRWTLAKVMESRADGQVKVQWRSGSGVSDEFLHRAKLGVSPAQLAKLQAAGNKP